MIDTNKVASNFYLSEKNELKLSWKNYLEQLSEAQRIECFELCVSKMSIDDISEIFNQKIITKDEFQSLNLKNNNSLILNFIFELIQKSNENTDLSFNVHYRTIDIKHYLEKLVESLERNFKELTDGCNNHGICVAVDKIPYFK